MKNKLVKFAKFLHLKIFSHEMSHEMESFLANLSWSFLAGLISLPLTMVVMTLAGRFMGPEEYGKYSLLLVVNQFLTILIFFGLDITSVKYIAKAKGFQQKKKVIATVSNFIFSILLLLGILTLIAYPFLLKFASGYTLFVLMLSFYSLVVTTKVLLDLVIRGLEEFKKQLIAKVLEVSVLIVSFIVIFIFLGKTSFASLILVINFGAMAISIYYLISIRKYLGRGDRKLLKSQLKEGNLFFWMALLGTLFLSSDRLVVARSLGVKTVGIYSAYYFGSYGVVAQLTMLFTNVFFPVTSRLEDKSFSKKIDRLFLIGFVPLLIICSLILLVILLIFGKEYPINYFYILGFSIFSSLYFFQALYNTVLADTTVIIYKKYLILRNAVNALTIAFYLLLVYLHIVSIGLVLAGMIINSIVVIYVEKVYIAMMKKTWDKSKIANVK